MTFTSHKNHQITHRNTRLWMWDKPGIHERATGLGRTFHKLNWGATSWCLLAIAAILGGNYSSASLFAEEKTPSLDSIKVPTSEEIDEQLRILEKSAATGSGTATREVVAQQLSALGGQPPSDVDSYPDPENDPNKLKKITAISPFRLAEEQGELPEEIRLGETSVFTPRSNPHMHYNWEASDMFHNPLYFEDFALERYGHSYPFVIQPFVSMGKFSGQLALLPYQMTMNPVRKCVYPLGYYRPGDYSPYLWYQIPFNLQAAAVQGGALTGMIFLIP